MSQSSSYQLPAKRHNRQSRGCVSGRYNYNHPLLQLFASTGLVLAVYALWVEHKVSQQGSSFHALCDFGDIGGYAAQCSQVLTSESSHLFFDVPNAAFGTLFYILAFSYPFLYNKLPLITPAVSSSLLLLATTFSVGLSVYLATVLYAMQEICLLCITTYAVNAFLWMIAFNEWRSTPASQHTAYKKEL